MPDIRTHRSIADRLEIDFRGPPQPDRRRFRVAMLCGGLAPTLLIAYFAARGDQRIYWARPTTTSHHMIAGDCGQCHTANWQPLQRLLTGDDTARSVTDDACQRCHPQTLHDHSPGMVSGAVRDCVLCHREHGNDLQLARVPSERCVDCHGGVLQTAQGPSESFVNGITSFADHPEFAVIRNTLSQGRLPGPRHAFQTLVRPDRDEPATRWRDASRLRFPHDKHMRPEGVLLPHDHPENATGKATRRLTCANCHVPRTDGQSMQPILFERHCQECHPLSFSTRDSEGGPLPHAQAELVLGALRQRLFEYARKNPEQVLSPAAARSSRLPNQRQDGASVQDEWEWVESQLVDVAGEAFRSTRIGCAQCHELAPAASLFEVLPPNIPERWLPHGRFDHRSHVMLACNQCHAAIDSQAASDILLPSITICRQCHGSKTRTIGGGAARADCVECHDYHHASEFFEGRDLATFLRPE